jgi:hypothetical protein
MKARRHVILSLILLPLVVVAGQSPSWSLEKVRLGYSGVGSGE